MVIVYLPCGMLPSTYTYHSGKDERWAGNWSLIWFGLNLACQQVWHTCYNMVQLHMNLYTVVVTTVQGNNIMCTCMTSDDSKFTQLLPNIGIWKQSCQVEHLPYIYTYVILHYSYTYIVCTNISAWQSACTRILWTQPILRVSTLLSIIFHYHNIVLL